MKDRVQAIPSGITDIGAKEPLQDWADIDWRQVKKRVKNLRQRIYRATQNQVGERLELTASKRCTGGSEGRGAIRSSETASIERGMVGKVANSTLTTVYLCW